VKSGAGLQAATVTAFVMGHTVDMMQAISIRPALLLDVALALLALEVEGSVDWTRWGAKMAMILRPKHERQCQQKDCRFSSWSD